MGWTNDKRNFLSKYSQKSPKQKEVRRPSKTIDHSSIHDERNKESIPFSYKSPPSRHRERARQNQRPFTVDPNKRVIKAVNKTVDMLQNLKVTSKEAANPILTSQNMEQHRRGFRATTAHVNNTAQREKKFQAFMRTFTATSPGNGDFQRLVENRPSHLFNFAPKLKPRSNSTQMPRQEKQSQKKFTDFYSGHKNNSQTIDHSVSNVNSNNQVSSNRVSRSIDYSESGKKFSSPGRPRTSAKAHQVSQSSTLDPNVNIQNTLRSSNDTTAIPGNGGVTVNQCHTKNYLFNAKKYFKSFNNTGVNFNRKNLLGISLLDSENVRDLKRQMMKEDLEALKSI